MTKIMNRITRTAMLAIAFMLCATSSAWAVEPVAVWDGDFTVTQTGYTLDRNGNALSQDNSTITIDQSVGVKVDFGSGVGGMTVMFRYSDLAFDAQKTLATSYVSGQDENRTGVYLASGGTANGIANTANWNNPVGTLSEPSGVLAFTYSGSGGTALYYISSLGVRTQIYYKGDLRYGADSSINGCTIGGERAKAGATLLSAATDMKITAIAIFNSVLSQSDMEGYLFPTDDPTSDFDYVATITANTTLGDITTWTKGSGTPDAASKVYINSENDAVLTIGGSLSLDTLKVVGGSIALANGASISSIEILGADVNIAASTEVTISDSTVRSKIICNGKLNTSGTTVLSEENEFASGSILNVGGTKTTLNAAKESLDGSIVIAAGAELENTRTSDALDFNKSTIVDVYGRLNMGNTRWTLKNGNTINLYERGVITGTGQGSYGALDAADAAVAINVKGTSTISAKLRTRNNFTLNVESGTLTYTGSTSGESGHTNNSVIKTGAGTIEATVAPKSKWTVNEGRVIQSVFPLYDVAINSGATFTLKNVAWTDQPSRFSGAGTLELYSETASDKNGYDHTVTGVTFPGILKLSNKTTQWAPPKFQCNINPASAPMFADGIRPELVCDSEQTHLGDGYYRNNLEQPLQVKNLSGSGQLRGQWGSGEYYYLVETMQERDTAYDGLFGCDYKGGNRYVNLSVIGNNASEIHSLTISQAQNDNDDGGCNASTLTVADNAKVVFTSGGKWGYGQIVVDEDGWLESTNTASIARTLTLNAGSHIALTPAAAITAGTVTLPATGTVYVDMSAFGLAEGSSATIISATTLTGGANVGNLQATSGNYTFAVDPENANAIKATNMGTCVWDGDSWNKADPSQYSDVTVNVAAGGTTLTLDSDYSFDSVTLSGSSGSLTIDANGHTLTVGDIVIPNGVTLIASSALTVSGTISGGGNLTVPSGVTFTNAAGTTWTIGKSSNETSNRSGVLTVQNGGELIINGRVNIENKYGSSIETVVVEAGGELYVSSTGNLNQEANYWSKFVIAGYCVVVGNMYNYGDLDVSATGSLVVSGTIANDFYVKNKGEIIYECDITRISFEYINNSDDGRVIFAPGDANIGKTVTDMTAIIDGSGTPALIFDVSNLSSLPTGTSAITLLTTSAIEPSLTGCSSDYYVKQDGTTGAVTLQLYAAKDDAGGYYRDATEALFAMVANHALTLTILDGTEETWTADALSHYGLERSGTSVYYVAARIGSTPYNSVQAAVDAAEGGETITLAVDSSDSITLNGKSIVFSEGSYTFSGSFTGNGTLIMTEWPKALATARWADGWEGVLWLKGVAFPVIASGGDAGKPTVNPAVFGNANSTLRLTGCTGGFNSQYITPEEFSGTLDLVDDLETSAAAFTVTSAWPAFGKTVFAKLTGSGTLTASDVTLGGHCYQFSDASDFEGAITLPSTTGRLRIIIGESTSDTVADRAIKILSGASTAVAAGKTWTAPGGFTVDGNLSVANTGTLTGTIAGGGTITYAALPAAPTFGSWTGTVVLPAISSGEVNFNNYGIDGSVVRVSSMTGGYLPNAAIVPTIDIPSGSTMTINGFSPARPNVVNRLTGEGTLALNVTATEGNDLLDVGNWAAWKGNDGYSAYLRIGDVSGFSGSLSPGTSTGIVIGDTKPAYNTVGGKIILNLDEEATVAASKSWTATTIQVGGDLSVAAGGTLSGEVEILNGGSLESTNSTALTSLKLNDGAKIVFPTSSSALTGITSITFASGTTTLALADGQEAGTLIDWSGASLESAPAGDFQIEGEAAGLYVVTKSTSGLSIAAAAARIGDTPYATVTEAVMDAFVTHSDHSIVVTVIDGSFDAETYEYKSALDQIGILWDGEAKTYSYAAASIKTSPNTSYYATIGDALSAAESGSIKTVNLYKDVTANPVLPADVSLNLGNYTLDGTVTAASGCVPSKRIVNGNVVYTADPDTTGEEWTDGSGDHAWNNANNWSLGFVPVANTPVTFPAGTHSINLATNNGTEKCGAMTVTGNVTFQRANADTWSYVQLNGDVSGDGTLTLIHVGLGALANRTIACPVVVDGTDGKDALCYSGGKTFTFSNTVTVSGQFKGHESWMVFNGLVTLNDGGEVYAYHSYYRVDISFNGGLTIPANAAVSLTRTSSGYHHIASAVTLNLGSRLTVPNDTTTSGATFSAWSPLYKVVSAAGASSTTVYSVEKKPGTIFSVW